MMGVFDSIELRMLRRADYVPTLFPTQVYVLTVFCGFEHASLWGACAFSHSLLSLAFTTRWNQKHPSYVSMLLFLKFLWICFFADLKSTSSVLFTFRDILFAYCHWTRLERSKLIALFNFFREWLAYKKLVSSAKWCTLECKIVWFKSLI